MKASSTALSRLLQSQASTSRSTLTLTSKPLLRAPPPPAQQRLSVCRPPLAARTFHSSAPAAHGGIHRPEKGTGIKVTFRDSKGADIKTVEANEGDDLLSVAHEYDVDLEGETLRRFSPCHPLTLTPPSPPLPLAPGACEGSIACSTCHVILEPDVYDSLEEPGDDENDMLDLAFGLTDTSRLGCQIKLTKGMDGMVAQLPSATRNMSFKKE